MTFKGPIELIGLTVIVFLISQPVSFMYFDHSFIYTSQIFMLTTQQLFEQANIYREVVYSPCAGDVSRQGSKPYL